MKKSLLIFGSLFLTSLEVMHATTVNFGAVPSARTVTAADGATTITSGLVWAGNFTSEVFIFNPALSINANIATITLAGGWQQFGIDTSAGTTNSGVTLSNLTINASGKVGTTAGPLTDNNSGATKADYFNSKALYLWIFNATTTASATQMGIFRATSATQAWNFAVNSNGVGDSVTYSTVGTGATPPTPTIAAIGGAGSTSSTLLQLSAITVPEPSVIALGGIAGLGMLASRRRKQRK